MIYFLTTPDNADTIAVYRKVAGASQRDRIVPMVYDELFATAAPPRGTYCFADLELLSDATRQRAAAAWQALADRGCRLLNHPTRSLLRYDLLTELRRRGINRFEACRLADRESPKRFPVFLRTVNDHKGSLSPLLESAEALHAAIESLRAGGGRLDDKLVVEFCETADATGLYRKYGAFIVGDRILPRHLFFSRRWVVKDWSELDAGLLAEERQYLATNPHARQLREVFAAAHIDYGRIDYSLLDGEIQVWEINTNPVIIGMGPSREAAGAARRGWAHRALRPVWTLLSAAIPALATLRDAVSPRPPAPPPRPIPRQIIHDTFAAMLEPAWRAIDMPSDSTTGSSLASPSGR